LSRKENSVWGRSEIVRHLSRGETAPAPQRRRARSTPLPGLREAFAKAEQAWGKTFEISPEEFGTYVLDRGSTAAPDWSSLHVADLLLACGCVRSNAEALRALRTYFDVAKEALLRMRLDVDVEDVLGTLWERLATAATDGTHLLESYTGRGSLASWIRSAATHEALSVRRRDRRRQAVQLAEAVAGDNPEMAYIKRVYNSEVQGAIAAAFRKLPAEDRRLLRSYYVEGHRIDSLAPGLGIHRATAARRVSTARARLRQHVLAHLREELDLSDTSVQSVLAALGEDFEADVHTLMRTHDSGEAKRGR